VDSGITVDGDLAKISTGCPDLAWVAGKNSPDVCTHCEFQVNSRAGPRFSTNSALVRRGNAQRFVAPIDEAGSGSFPHAEVGEAAS
jgi:hypothetical protein